MSKRLKLATAAAAALLTTCLLIAALRSTPEPTYKGRTIHEWLNTRSSESYWALTLLGTNNLPLLTKRIAYDPKKDLPAYLLGRIYRQTRFRFGWMANAAGRGNRLADDAAGVFYILGPKAAPAIPDLARIAEKGAEFPAQRAMSILVSVGDEGLAVLASRAAHGNAETRRYAVGLLASHPESNVSRLALTNALSDPDPRVRHAASQAFGNLGERAPSAVELLIKALSDPDKDIRIRATNALRSIAPELEEIRESIHR